MNLNRKTGKDVVLLTTNREVFPYNAFPVFLTLMPT